MRICPAAVVGVRTNSSKRLTENGFRTEDVRKLKGEELPHLNLDRMAVWQ